MKKESTMTRKVVHVTPKSEGTWAVKSTGTTKAFRIFESKHEAIQAAKLVAKNAQLGQVKIHGQNGRIQTEYTYGKDPSRYKG
jgi:hypothetical protein